MYKRTGIKTSWANARVKLHSQVHFGFWIKIWYPKFLTSFVLKNIVSNKKRSKNYQSEEALGPKRCWVPKDFGSKKILGQKNVGSKKFLVPKTLSQKKNLVKKCLIKKNGSKNNLDPKTFLSKQIFGKKKFLVQKKLWSKTVWAPKIVMPNKILGRIYLGPRYFTSKNIATCLDLSQNEFTCPHMIWHVSN